MAGFMSGFGSAFSRSFEAGIARSEERKKDAFRVAYDQYTKNQSQYDSDERAWNTALRDAETIVSAVGANIPKQAIPKVAEYVMAGYTNTQIEDILKKSKFEVAESQTPETPEIAPIDTQMEASGLAPAIGTPPLPEQEAAQAQNPALQAIQSVFPNAGTSDEERAAREVQEAAGITEDEFKRVNQGWVKPDTSNVIVTPLQISGTMEFPENTMAVIDGMGRVDVISKTEDTVTLIDGTVIPMSRVNSINSKDIYAQMDNMMQQIGNEGRKINDDGAGVQSLLGQVYKLDQMVVDDPRIITTVVQVGASIEDALNEIDVATDVLTELSNEQATQLEQELINSTEQNLSTVLGDTPQKARIFSSQLWSVVFQLARSQQGSGQLSNRDIENAYRQVAVSSIPETFRENLRQLASTEKDKWNNLAETFLNSDVQVKYASEQFPTDIIQNAFGPLETRLDDPINEWLSNPIAETNAPETETSGPLVGTIEVDDEGIKYEFMGGDPSQEANWKIVQ